MRAADRKQTVFTMRTSTWLYLSFICLRNCCQGQFPGPPQWFPVSPATDLLETLPVTLKISDNVTAPRWADVKDAIVTEILKTCGKDRVCNTTGYDLAGADIRCSPCDKCFCDETCNIFQDCCIDKIIDDKLYHEMINETVQDSATLAECMVVQFKNLYGRETETHISHRLISKCPANYHDPTVVGQCDGSGSINQHLKGPAASREHLLVNWPVASRSSLAFYKNRACAKCHDDDDSLVHWNIVAECEDFVIPSHAKNTVDYIDEILSETSPCAVTFEVPQNFQPRLCVHAGTYEIDSCNTTGARSNFDPPLWKTCEIFYQKLVLSSEPFKSYRNIFCLQCQYDRSINDKVFNFACDGDGTSLTPFFLILSADALEDVQDARKRDFCRCYENQVYDIYQKGCRNLTCATGKRLVDGECVSTVLKNLGLAYTVSLRFETTLSEDDVAMTGQRVFPQDENQIKEFTESLKTLFLDKAFGLDKRDVFIYTFTVEAEETTLTPNTTLGFQMKADLSLKYPTIPLDIEAHLSSFQGLNKWTLESKSGANFTFTSYYTEPANHELTAVNGIYALQTPIGSPDEFKVKYLVFIQNSPLPSAFDPGKIPAVYLEMKRTLVCPLMTYKARDDHVEIVARNNQGTDPTRVLVHRPTGVELSYTDFNVQPDGRVTVCAHDIIAKMTKDTQGGDVDAIDIFGARLVVTSHICLGLSVLTLFLTLVTYCIFPTLRTLPGKSTMGLVLTLFLAITLFLIGGLFIDDTAVCQAVGVATHFFLLSSFTWMVICTAHMYNVFSSITKQHANEGRNILRFLLYFTISIVIPSVIVSTTIIANYIVSQSSDAEKLHYQTFARKGGLGVPSNCKSHGTEIGYGMGICYLSNKESLLYAGAFPIIVPCTVNLVLFAMAVFSFRKMTSQEKMVRKDERNHLLLYIKLSTLTGINWLPCTIAAFVSSLVLWYLFLILCGLQGLFVFISFVLNKRVLDMYKGLLQRETPCKKSLPSRETGRQQKYVHDKKDDNHSKGPSTMTTGSGAEGGLEDIKQN